MGTRGPMPLTEEGLALVAGPSALLLGRAVTVCVKRGGILHHERCAQARTISVTVRRTLSELLLDQVLRACCQDLLDEGSGLARDLVMLDLACESDFMLPREVTRSETESVQAWSRNPDLRVFERRARSAWDRSLAYHGAMSDADALEVLDLAASLAEFDIGWRHGRVGLGTLAPVVERLGVGAFARSAAFGPKDRSWHPGFDHEFFLERHAARARPEGMALVVFREELETHPVLGKVTNLRHAVARFTVGSHEMVVPRSVARLVDTAVVVDLVGAEPTDTDFDRARRVGETAAALAADGSTYYPSALVMAHALEN